MDHDKVSLPLIRRLPRYYRFVSELKDNGVATISSSELANQMGTTASQIRQDFNCFGEFGQQGIGYTVDLLHAELEKLIFGGRELNIILIGTGRLGRAITYFLSTEAKGYKLTALFDVSPTQIGEEVSGLTVKDVAALPAHCKNNKPDVAVLCIPEHGTQELAATLYDLGVKGYWNFSHYELDEDRPGTIVENVHLGDSLMSLGYQVRQLKHIE